MKAVIVGGIRTPFAKAGSDLKGLSAIELGKVAVREDLAREVGLATLPKTVPATTVSRQCTTANQAISDAANLIEAGVAEVVVAGGSESLSHIPIMVSEDLSDALVTASKAKTLGQRVT